MTIKLDTIIDGNNTQWIGNPKDYGYLVAIECYGAKIERSPDGTFDRERVSSWVKEVMGLPCAVRHFDTIGSWIDNDILYLDVCIWISDKREAIGFGMDENQIAIWDIENNQEIRL